MIELMHSCPSANVTIVGKMAYMVLNKKILALEWNPAVQTKKGKQKKSCNKFHTKMTHSPKTLRLSETNPQIHQW